MRWTIRAIAALFVLLVACGGEESADAPSPSPGGGIVQPADDARDTVDQLEDRQEDYGR